MTTALSQKGASEIRSFSENSSASAMALRGSTALHNTGTPASHKHRLLSQQAGQITPSWYQLSLHAQLSFTLNLPVTHHLLISFISTSTSPLMLLCVIMKKGQPFHPCTHSSKATASFRALSKLSVKYWSYSSKLTFPAFWDGGERWAFKLLPLIHVSYLITFSLGCLNLLAPCRAIYI